MRYVARLLTPLFALLVAGCRMPSMGGSEPAIKGSGKVIHETRKVAGFTAVSLRGSGRLLIEETGTESLTITAEDNLLPYLTSEVRDTQLILGAKDNANLQPTGEIVYKLTVKHLEEIEVAGSGAVEAKGIHTNRLKATIGGSGDLTVDGKAEHQEITLAGSGNYRADNLKSDTVKIDIAGSGNAALAVHDKLDANILGSGSVEYIGDPAVTQNVLGSGTVRKR